VRGKHSWRSRKFAVAAVVAVASLAAVGLLAGGAGAGKRDITLTVSVFGNFGYKDLYAQYEKAHPGITIKEDSQSYPDHHTALAQHLATGAGADDVEAIEVGFIGIYTAQADKFVDLREYGASALKKLYLPWKFAQAVAPNGTVVGLGTDVGSLGICYRKDLFKQAGLPSDRAAVSRLLATWDGFINAGKRFQAKAPAGVHFLDSGSNLYNAILAQQNPGYYDSKGNVIVATNPKVKYAWNETMKAISAGIDVGLSAFSNDWNTGFQKGTFATVTCPAWMMGYIQGQAPKTKGLWDIASVPVRGGSWGGSFLTVPKQSKHPAEAADLAKFLTSAASQLYVFKQTGNLSSQIAVLKSKAVQNFRNPFFSNAPVGKIFANSVFRLTPQPLGPHQGDFQNDVSNAIQRVEQGKQTPDKSWAQFLKDVKNHS
jgi:cellobiose transport system substrate-binding protein